MNVSIRSYLNALSLPHDLKLDAGHGHFQCKYNDKKFNNKNLQLIFF